VVRCLERDEPGKHRIVLANKWARCERQALSFAELALRPGKVGQADIMACPIALLGNRAIWAKMIVVTSTFSIEANSISRAIPWARFVLTRRSRRPLRAYD